MFCEISGGQFSGGKVVSFQAEETCTDFLLKLQMSQMCFKYKLFIQTQENIFNFLIMTQRGNCSS